MSKAVQDILERIQQLPEEDRLLLEQQLAAAEWKRKVEATGRWVLQEGSEQPGEPGPGARLTPAELRSMPRDQRQAILAAAAALAEEDYRSDKELTGFEAFSEEELDDDESDSR